VKICCLSTNILGWKLQDCADTGKLADGQNNVAVNQVKGGLVQAVGVGSKKVDM